MSFWQFISFQSNTEMLRYYNASRRSGFRKYSLTLTAIITIGALSLLEIDASVYMC